MKRILALIDFSEVTPAVVKIGREMARAFNCELLLLHVAEFESEANEGEVREDPLQEMVSGRSHHREMEILAMMMKKEGVSAVTQIVRASLPRDSVTRKILQESTRLSPDLIVVGSHGHGRLYQLLAGSVADTVVRKATCPVVIVPSRKQEKVAS
jgi:nucleotide-binding universal stress UspA family protein